ncbi:SMI1/KNR4 family protein [Actinoallomurus purpureus]|uniref:SMI1/KNR4 family protein n=1 Tax=Actinoallomurus purpureus TaxID=478114 RepID=UPI002091FF81|nr:SMI1/KNR4 family protein [Actinoallomurus purpureus]MCO6011040.1 SMI1/KNR4 family protein [Actinoallomurus purpureus]
MSGVASVVTLVELLRDNPESCRWTGGLSPEDLDRAERELGTAFPPAYRRFLAELGSCDVDGTEFLGVYRTPAIGDTLLGTVSETLQARTDPRFPPDLLVIQHDGMGGLVSLDVSRRDDAGESPVVVWDPGSADRGGPERLADDFGAYALRQCRRALTRGG